MSSLGKNFRITIFGASHGEAIGVVMEGLPVGFAIDMDALNAFLTRRAPGRGAFATARRESDAPLFLSGVKNGVTCGGAVAAVIRNGDAHPGDYDALRNTPRPGHADFAARMKDGDAVDLSGGGRFSGRLTAPLCVAGGIAMQLLEEENIRIVSHIASIAGIADEGIFPASTLGKPFPTLSEARGEEMLAAIAKARADGDSVGGVVECAVLGLPAGLGDARGGCGNSAALCQSVREISGNKKSRSHMASGFFALVKKVFLAGAQTRTQRSGSRLKKAQCAGDR